MDFLKEIIKQLKSIFANMSKSQRVSFVLVIVSIVFCMIAVFLWSSQPDYAVLFSDLSTDDAAKIHAKLNEMKVPYEVNGTTITVPSKFVYETRLQLANEGLPKGSTIGYEIFDKTSLGQTDYLQRLNFQRALEGELSRTISSLDSVEFARVHLVLPKPTIFSEKEEKVSASIIITPRNNRVLSKNSVVAISHLVASSVEGLDTGEVTIIDSTGNLLSSTTSANMSVGLTTSQLEVQRNIEQYLSEKVLSLLIGVLGPGKAIVRVNADVDFSQTERTKESFNPESQVARSENRIEEASSSKKDETGASTEKTITNYEIDKTVEHIIGATGKIQRLTIAVVVDGTYKFEGEGNTRERVYAERSEDEKQSIMKLVNTAIGLDLDRGDTIEVINIPFDTSYLEEERAALEQMRRVETIKTLSEQWGPWVIVLAVCIALFVMLQKVISQASVHKPTVSGGVAGGSGMRGRAAMEENLYEKMREHEMVEKQRRNAENEIQKILREEMEEEVIAMAEANPDAVAKIIKDWLAED